MLVDVKVDAVVQANIDSEEAFRILCKTLQMEFVLDDDVNFFVKRSEYGHNCVYCMVDGCERRYDDRGDLFIALRNVAVNMFPNLGFRNEKYIYHK